MGIRVKRSGKWMMTLCPSHPDGEKSGGKPAGYSLGLSDKGVLKCFAGCDFKDVLKALKESGPPPPPKREPSRSGNTPRRPSGGVGPNETVTRVYDYVTEKGRLVAQKARIETNDGTSKRFTWRMPGVEGWPSTDNGGGLIGIGVHETPLLHSEKIPDVDMGDWIVFTEGEKAAEACWSHQIPAVCASGGASQTNFGDSMAILAGRKVAIWPDNDNAGQKYAITIQRALQQVGVASTYMIRVPVPHKGDAYDYFDMGGDPAMIFTTTWSEPLVEFIGDESIRVTVYTENGPIAFSFMDLAETARGELNCELMVEPLLDGIDVEPYETRINLLSSSAREGLERQCKKQFEEIGTKQWTMAISQGYSRCRRAWRSVEPAKLVGTIQPRDKNQLWVLGDYLLRGHPTIMFGDGGSGKTWLTYAMALALATGSPLWGMRSVQQGPVVVLDYETEEDMCRDRMDRLFRGMNLPGEFSQLPIHYWPGKGKSLLSWQEPLRKFIEREGAVALLVDSGAPACGGPPENSEQANAYFNGLQNLGVTSLTICHISGESDGTRPFGSRFWHNRARRTFHITGNTRNGGAEIGLQITPRKANDGKFPPRRGNVVYFEDDGAVRITAAERRQPRDQKGDEEWLMESIVRMLTEADRPVLVYEVADKLMVEPAAVTTFLTSHEDSFKAVYDRAGKKAWTLVS
jgi:hypothetical protein